MSLGALTAAALLPNLIWSVLLLTSVEHVEIDLGNTARSWGHGDQAGGAARGPGRRAGSARGGLIKNVRTTPLPRDFTPSATERGMCRLWAGP